MPVDEQIQQVLDYYATFGAPALTSLSPQEARQRPTVLEAVNGLRQQRGEVVAPEAVGDVHDEIIQGPEGKIHARVYRPGSGGPFPLLMYFHGGGWVLGNLDSCDVVCRALANLAQCLVVSVDYRLAPEYPFPAAAQDAYAATQWAAAAAPALGADGARIAVGGESSGGNLAAVVALMARDSHTHMPIYQALAYPVMNDAFDTPSYEHNAYVRPLTREEMRWFWGHYLPNAAAGANPYASPLRAEDVSGLPPALMLTAEYDVLRDEGEAYARRLQEAGVPVVLKRCEGMTHGFLSMAPVVQRASSALEEMAGWLREAFTVTGEIVGASTPDTAGESAAEAQVQAGLRMTVITRKVASAPVDHVLEVMEEEAVLSTSLEEDATRGERAQKASAEETAVPLAPSAAGAWPLRVQPVSLPLVARAPAPHAAETSEAGSAFSDEEAIIPGAPLETGLALRVGMEVVGSDGYRMGKVKAVRTNDFVVDRRFRRDVALPFEAVHEAVDRVVLIVPAKEAAKTHWSELAQ